jgi:predicted ester cyclase
MDTPDTTPTTSTAQANEELVRQFYIPFNTGDVSIYDRILAPNWIDDPLSPGQQPGPDGFKAKIIEFRQTIPGYQVTNDEILVAGNKVAVHSTVRSTLRKPTSGTSPSDRPFEMRTCDFHHIEHGRIVSTWHLEDFYGLFQYLGAIPGR